MICDSELPRPRPESYNQTKISARRRLLKMAWLVTQKQLSIKEADIFGLIINIRIEIESDWLQLTRQRVIHVEAIELDVLQVETSVDKNSETKMFYVIDELATFSIDPNIQYEMQVLCCLYFSTTSC